MPSLPSPAPAPRLCPVSAIRSCPIDWLWLSHLALGELAVLEGDPGLGKSFVALDLCARLSTGRPWPDDAPASAPANSIVLNGEDDPERTLGPRLAGLGADLARVFVLDRQDTDRPATLSLPTDVEALEALVTQVQARLVVIDRVLAFFSAEVNVCSNASVRRALAPLSALARDHACAVLLIRHLPRPGQMSPLQPRRQHLFVRGAGSTRAGGRNRLTYAGMRWSCGNVFWVKHASYI